MGRIPRIAPPPVEPEPYSTVVIVPCYNEADRLPVNDFELYAQQTEHIRFLFVNDGSSDSTATLLAEMAVANPIQFQFLNLTKNGGKAEAIRQGMLHALPSEPAVIGFWDADLSTPLEPIADFRRALDRHAPIEIVVGSRLPLLGRQIHRTPVRRLLGRLFATVASTVLGIRIRDTQCGAKIFRVTPDLHKVFAEPFLSKWIFDVELIARYGQLRQRVTSKPTADFIYEQPLEQWEEVGGSRLKSNDFLTAIFDLARIYWRHLRPGAPAYLGLSPPGTSQSSSTSTDDQPSLPRAA